MNLLNSKLNQSSLRIKTNTINLRSHFSVQPPWPTTRATCQATRAQCLTGFPPARTTYYICWNAQPNWRYRYLGLNPSLCGTWQTFCLLATRAPQKSLFIRNVRLLKDLGEARGRKEEKKENRKGKMKGKSEQRVERCYRGSEILSELWTSLRCELLVAWPEMIPICLWLEERHPKGDKVTEQLHKAYTCFLCTLRNGKLQVCPIVKILYIHMKQDSLTVWADTKSRSTFGPLI